ncbi:MAG TPA: hypothetical protein VM163_03890 [bacterium]|nr:hypothetical protein [bacterium]
MMHEGARELDERAIQSFFFRYPQIVESFLVKKHLPVSGLEATRCEDACASGRVDLAFRQRASNSMVLLELQLGRANRDHYDRLASYVNDYSERFSFSRVIGVHFAEAFPKTLPRYSPPLYRVRFAPSKVARLAEELQAQEERLLGLSCPKPPVSAFARLSYLNGFFAFMRKRTFATFREVVENVANLAKNPRQIRNPEYRARLWVKFGESFGLLIRQEGRIVLTELGRAYAASLDASFPWALTARQRRILIAGLSAARCTNGHKFGIFCILKAAEQSEERALETADSQMQSFVSFCRSSRRWVRVSQRASFVWYGNYARELGLCPDSGLSGARLQLTAFGREVLALFSRQFAAFEMERRLLLRGTGGIL